MKRRKGSLLAAGVVAAVTVGVWACGDVVDPEAGTIVFDIAEIPANITRVVGRVAGDSVDLTPVGSDTGYAARGSITVSVGEHVVQVDAYEDAALWYTGKDTVDVADGETVPATVVMRCVNDGCDGSGGGGVSIFSAFPRPESEPNNSAATCDTTSWSRNFELITGPGVWAPYTYGGSGRITSDTDVDYWCAFIDFSAGDSLVAFTITDGAGGLDPVLTLYNPAGAVLTSNDNAGGENPNDARVEWYIPSIGRYYLAVSAAAAPTAPGRYSVFMHVGLPATIP